MLAISSLVLLNVLTLARLEKANRPPPNADTGRSYATQGSEEPDGQPDQGLRHRGILQRMTRNGRVQYQSQTGVGAERLIAVGK